MILIYLLNIFFVLSFFYLIFIYLILIYIMFLNIFIDINLYLHFIFSTFFMDILITSIYFTLILLYAIIIFIYFHVLDLLIYLVQPDIIVEVAVISIFFPSSRIVFFFIKLFFTVHFSNVQIIEA